MPRPWACLGAPACPGMPLGMPMHGLQTHNCPYKHKWGIFRGPGLPSRFLLQVCPLMAPYGAG